MYILKKTESEIDTSLLVRKTYLRTKFTESKTEEELDLSSHFRTRNVPHLINIREAASKYFFDNKFNDPSMRKKNRNTVDVDFKYKTLDNVRFPKLNSYLATCEHAGAKYYVDQRIDEPTLVTNN